MGCCADLGSTGLENLPVALKAGPRLLDDAPMRRLTQLLPFALLLLGASAAEAICEVEHRLAMLAAGAPIEQIEALLAESTPAEPTAACRGTRTPLEIAAEYGRPDVVRLLLDHGAAIHRAPLWAASQQDDPVLMRMLIDALPAAKRAAGLKDGLEGAATAGHHVALAEFLRLGADPSAPGAQALEYAAARGDVDGVRLLIEAGFAPDDPRAFRAALAVGDPLTVGRALAAGADPHANDPRTGNALSRLAGATGMQRAERDAEVAGLLLARGVDPNVPHLGRRPLGLARERGADALAARLESAGGRDGSTLSYKVDRAGRAFRRAGYAVVLLFGGGH
jgi:ankyrin repeat protein